MVRFLSRVVELLDASHLFIGFCAFLLTLETYVVFGWEINYAICLFIACATVLFYSTHRLFQIHAYADIPSDRIIWLRRNKGVLKSSIFASALVVLLLLFLLFSNYMLYVGGLAVLSGLYLFPLLKNGRRVRDTPFLKIFAIAFGWALVTVVIPAFMQQEWPAVFSAMIVERVLFFILITIPFDIRDRSDDRRKGVHTLATQLSRKQLNGLMFLLFVLHFIWVLCLPFDLSYAIALLVSSVLALLAAYFADERKPLWYFSLFVDGLIALRICVLYLVLAL